MEFNLSEIIMLLFATIGPLKVTIVCATLTAGRSAGVPQESGIPIGPDRFDRVHRVRGAR